jgi:hypothetical protein
VNFGDWIGLVVETGICGYFAYAVVRVLDKIENRKGGDDDG